MLIILLVGCYTPSLDISTQVPETPTRTAILEPAIRPASATPAPSSTVPPPRSATPTATTIPRICSPLAEIERETLPELVSNPFDPPHPGSDLPHQGVDLSLVDPVAGYALDGHTVKAVLAGEVAAVINNRFPYGYALLIETRDLAITSMLKSTLTLPTPLQHPLQPVNLTCPQTETYNSILADTAQEPNNPGDLQERSIYILYAHLQSPLNFQPGDRVQCGQRVGLVGVSGNALHPHLHLEIRIGPPGMRFDSMAHYDNSATQEEMASYCIWRVSGIFQLVDPMPLLALVP